MIRQQTQVVKILGRASLSFLLDTLSELLSGNHPPYRLERVATEVFSFNQCLTISTLGLGKRSKERAHEGCPHLKGAHLIPNEIGSRTVERRSWLGRWFAPPLSFAISSS